MVKLVSLNKEFEDVTVDSDGKTQLILEVPKKDTSKLLNVLLNREGAEVEILGVFVGRDSQKINLVVNAIHKVPNTKCLTQIRGVLMDDSFSSFKGMIKIEKDAQKTNSYLDHDVLVIGDGARNQSEPNLEIEADDVKATHGATTGRILPDHLFYLQSRGLTKEEVEGLIVGGFLEPVIARINDAKIRSGISRKVGLLCRSL